MCASVESLLSAFCLKRGHDEYKRLIKTCEEGNYIGAIISEELIQLAFVTSQFSGSEGENQFNVGS